MPKVVTNSEGIFDYAIPPAILPQIKFGLLVLVPFHGRKVEGIIVEIKRSSTIKNLKSILSVIDPIPVIDENHFKLAEWISNYYLAPLSKCLFENIVPPAKRTIKKSTNSWSPQVNINNSSNSAKNQCLVMANFNERLKFYQKTIEKTLLRNRQIIILVPDLALIPFFTRTLEGRIAVLSADLSRTQRWQEWDKIRRGEVDIVIGSNSALFAPLEKLGLIIIDQEENETYKNYQTPRFDTIDVAKKLAKLTQANLILGSQTPSIETFFETKNQKMLLRKSSPAKKEITIVDMNSERSALSTILQEKIEKTFEDCGKIVLLLNRKGEGMKIICKDCGWVQRCPECHWPLRPIENAAYCKTCEKSFPPKSICPQCSSPNLKATGLTTLKLEKILKNLFPQRKIIRVESGANINLKLKWDLAITTSFALKFAFPPVSLVGIIDADQEFFSMDFKSNELAFSTIFKFLNMAPEGIIQTHLPQTDLILSLADLNYEEFYSKEIAAREKNEFPPFTKLIRILVKEKSQENTLEMAKNLKEKLEAADEAKILKIFGPLQLDDYKKRGNFYCQLIIKYKNNLPEKLENILRNVSKNIVLDIDPFKLNPL